MANPTEPLRYEIEARSEGRMEPGTREHMELAIAETGFSFDDDYSERRWIVGKTTEFEVLDEFPRVTTPLRTGVSGVRYKIALEACAPFTAEPGTLDGIILEGGGEWTN